MSEWLRFWDWTAAEWAGVQCIILVGAAIVAWRQVREARRLREAQAQPFVVVDFEIEKHQEIYLVTSNIGTTMARNVRVTFAPSLTSSLDGRANVTAPSALKPLAEGIPSLPPGKRVRILFDIFVQRPQHAFADSYSVVISYEAHALKKTLHDESVIDLGIYRNVLHADERHVHDVHERLKELVSEVRKWTAGGSGILALDPAQARARMADTLDFHAERNGRLPTRIYHRTRRRTRRLLLR